MRSRIKPKLEADFRAGARLNKFDIAAQYFCSVRYAEELLRVNRKTWGIYPVAWMRNHGGPIATFAAYGQQAERPARLTSCERNRENRKNPAYRETENFKKRLARTAGKPPIQLGLAQVLGL